MVLPMTASFGCRLCFEKGVDRGVEIRLQPRDSLEAHTFLMMTKLARIVALNSILNQSLRSRPPMTTPTLVGPHDRVGAAPTIDALPLIAALAAVFRATRDGLRTAEDSVRHRASRLK